jgi:hypothetical protein
MLEEMDITEELMVEVEAEVVLVVLELLLHHQRVVLVELDYLLL